MEGGGADNLTKVIINAVKTFGGVEHAKLATQLTSFGARKLAMKFHFYF